MCQNHIRSSMNSSQQLAVHTTSFTQLIQDTQLCLRVPQVTVQHSLTYHELNCPTAGEPVYSVFHESTEM